MRQKGSRKWLLIKDLPDNDDQWCVFACFIMGSHGKPIIIQNWIATIKDTKEWRKWNLENEYTHFMLIKPPILDT